MLRLQSQNLVHGLDGAPDEDIELKDMVCSIGICSEISSRGHPFMTSTKKSGF